jgi:hypothetical protein
VAARRGLSSSSGRPFNVLGIQQVAIGGLDKQLLSNFWVDTLGVPKVGEYRAEVSTGVWTEYECEQLGV